MGCQIFDHSVAALAGGAEIVLIPEVDSTLERVVQGIRVSYERGKSRALVVVAEGARYNATALAPYFREHGERLGFDIRVTIIEHMQRGGAPTAFDRLLAIRLGAGAVAALDRGEEGVLVGMNQSRVTTTKLSEVVGIQKSIDPDLFALATSLKK